MNPTVHPERAGHTLIRRRSLLLGISLALSSGTVFAADNNDSHSTLPPLVVSGDRLDANPDADITAEGYIAHSTSAGTKTDTPVSEVPQSISVVTEQQIEDQNPMRAVDALRYTPGITTEIYGGATRSDTYTSSRGMGLDFYMDDLAVPDGQSFGGWAIDPYLIERAEFLRGPSSILYGQASPGGTLNYVIKKPTFEDVHQIRAEYGSDAWRKLGIDLGGAVAGRDDLAYRLVMTGLDAHQSQDPESNRRQSFAPSLTWKPNDATELTLSAGYYNEDSSNNANFLPAAGTVLSSPYGRIDRDLVVGNSDYEMYKKREVWYGYSLKHDFNSNWQFRQKLRYARTRAHVKNVYGGNGPGTLVGAPEYYIARIAANTRPEYKRTSLDNMLEGHVDTGPINHTILLGVNYEDAENHDPLSYGVAAALNPYDPQRLPTLENMITTYPDEDTTDKMHQLGYYAQDQMKFGDHWAVTLGGRYARAKTETSDNIAGTSTSQTDHAFSGRAGVVYLSDIGLNPYISYSESFTPQMGTTASGSAFEPTEGKQYEAGLKYMPNDSDIELTAAVFDLRRTNVLQTDPNNSAFRLPMGEVRSRGIELGAKGEVLPHFVVQAAYTYQSVVRTKTTDDTEDKHPSAIPRDYGSVWGKYSFTKGALAGVDVAMGLRYVGESEGNNDNSYEVPDFALLDASVSYQLTPKMKLAVNATNLTDKDYISTCSNDYSCFAGPGRRVIGSVTYDW